MRRRSSTGRTRRASPTASGRKRCSARPFPKRRSTSRGCLALPDPRLIAFAPNTHEFVARLYSCSRLDADAARAHHRQRISQLQPPDAPARGDRPARGHPRAGGAVRDLSRALSGHARAPLRHGVRVPGVLRLRFRRRRTGGVALARRARGDRRDRRLSRVHGDPGRPRPSRATDLLHGRRLQVRAGRRGRVLHVHSAGLRPAPALHRLVLRLRPAERRSRGCRRVTATPPCASGARRSTRRASIASTP